MARIQRTEIEKQLIDEAGLDVGREKTPTELAEKVVPVLDSGIKWSKDVFRNTQSGNGTAALVTLQSNQRMLITSATIDCVQRAAAVAINANVDLQVTINGQSVKLATLRMPTNLEDSKVVNITFPMPLLIDAGSTINLIVSSGDADTVGEANVYGRLFQVI